jgi:hypothetical protein|tara:strand:+ start:1079 stop:1267 length:189 start_codon:yes stop_codon:yes gene_type:complete
VRQRLGVVASRKGQNFKVPDVRMPDRGVAVRGDDAYAEEPAAERKQSIKNILEGEERAQRLL